MTTDRAEDETSPQEEREETARAIQRGLDDMHAGRTIDAFESAARLRQKIESIAKRKALTSSSPETPEA